MVKIDFRTFLSEWRKNLLSGLKTKAYRKQIAFWFLALSALSILGLIIIVGILFHFSKTLPSLEILERIEPNLITRVYDKNHALVHEFYTQRRIWTPIEKIPELQKQAVFAIEDQVFYKHWGVDLNAYPSALLPALMGKRMRGASTLTQQLAKNLFLSPERSLGRKVRELMVAVKIEQTYTKDEILEFYFNQVYMGAGAYGFQAAAQRYYSKSLEQLSLSQMALLAGLLQRPEAYRPDLSPELAKDRRNTVLGAMKSKGFITRQQMKEAMSEPIAVTMWQAPNEFSAYYMETIRQFMEKKWNEDFVYNQGVSVYTTLDSSIQAVAESSLAVNLHKIQLKIKYRTARTLGMAQLLKENIDTVVRHWDKYYPYFDSVYLQADTGKEKQRFPDSLRYRHAQAAVLVIENETGAVRALIGGEDFVVSKYNRALQALRSPGSSFKPFVYSTAIDNGASPGNMLNDQPITIPNPMDSTQVWRPHNYDDSFSGPITMRRALYKSKNLPAIEVAMKYGLNTVVSYARKFGLAHNVPAVPSLGIGSCEATLMEMVSAYTAFPNGGVRPMPYFIDRINDKNGRLIYQNIPATQEVLRKEAAWIMCSMLQDVNIHGTAAAIWASGFNYPSGGKTGTTNDYSDAWYIGFTKHYTTGIWVGVDDHRSLGVGHTGADDAVPTWLAIMRYAHKGLKLEGFEKPPGVVQATVCQTSGLLAQSFCKQVTTDYYIQGYQPTEACSRENHLSSAGDVFKNNSTHSDKEPNSQTEVKKTDHRVRKTF